MCIENENFFYKHNISYIFNTLNQVLKINQIFEVNP